MPDSTIARRTLTRTETAWALCLTLVNTLVIVTAVTKNGSDVEWTFAFDVVAYALFALSFIGYRVKHFLWAATGFAFGVGLIVFARV